MAVSCSGTSIVMIKVDTVPGSGIVFELLERSSKYDIIIIKPKSKSSVLVILISCLLRVD
jgi:hypothetical protein